MLYIIGAIKCKKLKIHLNEISILSLWIIDNCIQDGLFGLLIKENLIINHYKNLFHSAL